MNNPKTEIVDPKSESNLHGWAAVRYFAERAQQFEHASLACRVMAGFELIDLYTTFARQGARNDIEAVAKGLTQVKPWQQWCREDAGISDDRARVWMQMADAARNQFGKLRGEARLRTLMETPVRNWNDGDRQELQASLSKITTATTQADFMRELGIGPARGGWNRGQTGGQRAEDRGQKAEGRKAAAEAAVKECIGAMALLQKTRFAMLVDRALLEEMEQERVMFGRFLAPLLKQSKHNPASKTK